MNGDPSAEELSLIKPGEHETIAYALSDEPAIIEHESLLNKAISEGDVQSVSVSMLYTFNLT